VLTQREHFGGSIEDLSVARVAVDLPILRKDFIDDEYQLYQAKAYGADAVLLIAGGLDDRQLRNLQNEASDIGLDCLVEAHDEQELHRALETAPKLLGINNRDLTTLKVDRGTTQRLAGLVPRGAGTFVVAESGYEKPEHLIGLEQLGIEAVLIGTALMHSDDPAGALADWLNPSEL
jgi:indole-3-glycerol phosphate synthase